MKESCEGNTIKLMIGSKKEKTYCYGQPIYSLQNCMRLYIYVRLYTLVRLDLVKA